MCQMGKEEEKRQKKTGIHELKRRHGFVCFARTFEKSGEHLHVSEVVVFCVAVGRCSR